MHYILPIILLIISNIFMTLAWYGHLKLQDMHVIHGNTPLYVVILISWGLALMEYCFMVPANRLGFQGIHVFFLNAASSFSILVFFLIAVIFVFYKA